MSSYGHFIVEVKTNSDGWQRINWKTPKKLYTYGFGDDDVTESDDYVHKYALVSQVYRFRDALRSGNLGSTGRCNDFTEETNSDIKKFSGDYGWYEGWFLLSELETYTAGLRKSLEEYKQKNILNEILNNVKKIKAKLNDPNFTEEEEETYFDEYYEADIEDMENEIDAATYLENLIYFLANETCGYVNSSDVRVIVVGG